MLEVLVAMLIVAFGVLGFLGLQAQTAVVNLESYQRAQALVLAKDMAERIEANRGEWAAYDTGGYVGPNDPEPCTGTRASRDRCEWTKLLRGAAEGPNSVGIIHKPRGCVQPVGADVLYVAVFWEGHRGSGLTKVQCGSSTPRPQDINDDLLRGVGIHVRRALLG